MNKIIQIPYIQGFREFSLQITFVPKEEYDEYEVIIKDEYMYKGTLIYTIPITNKPFISLIKRIYSSRIDVNAQHVLFVLKNLIGKDKIPENIKTQLNEWNEQQEWLVDIKRDHGLPPLIKEDYDNILETLHNKGYTVERVTNEEIMKKYAIYTDYVYDWYVFTTNKGKIIVEARKFIYSEDPIRKDIPFMSVESVLDLYNQKKIQKVFN